MITGFFMKFAVFVQILTNKNLGISHIFHDKLDTLGHGIKRILDWDQHADVELICWPEEFIQMSINRFQARFDAGS